jgi:hypothetical protein
MRAYAPRKDSYEESLITWLRNIEYHSEAGSREDRIRLVALATNPPHFENLNGHLLSQIKEIQAIATRSLEQFDKSLKQRTTTILILFTPTTSASSDPARRTPSPKSPRFNLS